MSKLLNYEVTMEVKNVYQDASGKWHIEYSNKNLMGLALRVYAGHLLLSIVIFIFLGLPLFLLMAIASAKSLDEKPNISPSSNSDAPQESVCQEILN